MGSGCTRGNYIQCKGAVETGILKLNDTVEIVGYGDKNRSAVVTAIESFRKLLDLAEPADNVGLLLRGIERDKVHRGHVITKNRKMKSYAKFSALVHFAGNENEISTISEKQIHFFIRTVEVLGTVSILNAYNNGEYAEVTVELEDSLAMEPGICFAMRDANQNVVGFGKVSEV